MTNNFVHDIINIVMDKIDEKNIANYNAAFYKDEKEDSLGINSLVDRSSVPVSHKRIADSFMFIKKLYGSFMVYSGITNQERALLAKFDFAPLEYSTANQIKEEISFLKKWSSYQDEKMSKAADEILQIRVKELKNILSNRYVFVSNEIYTGYRILEQYLENISKYN